ncbi:MAG: phosphatidylglycerol lysyltransferase domain-containing protein [Eubacteriales bacterium]|nr:phosphatidylglycerol lysyltransferase domain-containing protein [Eubacteriales bacterium]MDD3537891.1 phosphatidylglycerol lysyltransferase domain-containing protein [Eubacteriales bacterium]MDD4286586.1 phosphatidylglycerol lysyltransferase domain-containing protein [Eubacteriales bacterium]HPF19314.1 phosphatidylglycerol lysyltransferase domain-containing protein [Bacillota bacterium]
MGIDTFQTFGNPIELESKEVFRPYFDANPLRSSGQGFASLYMWSQQRYAVIDGLLCIAGQGWFGQEYGGPFLYPPLSADGQYDPEHLRKVILQAKEMLRDPDWGFRLFGVPGKCVPLYDEALAGYAERKENRDNWDYIYRRSDLETLSGRKYTKKRNHLNHFYATHRYLYESIRPEHVPELMEGLERFSSRRAARDAFDELIQEEILAVKKILPVYEQIGMFGGLIRIDGVVKAFALGSRHTADTVEVTVEKADPTIRGLYQAINREFAASLPAEILYINREEDMGVEGLRQAKKSYYPCCMLEVSSYEFLQT